MISNKCSYALRAMLELAKREGSGPATILDIAQSQDIPARFLEAILRQLKQSGLTESVRGKRGGYVLARPAKQISVGDVIRLIEGPLIQPDSGIRSTDSPATVDVFGPIWNEAAQAVNQVYDTISFAELAEAERRETFKYMPDYSI